MKCLSVQLQTDLDTTFDEKDIISLVRSIGRYPEIDRGDDKHKYIHLNFFSENVTLLWEELKAGFMKDQAIYDWMNTVAIIICEGDTDSDDYLLLAHYDKTETIHVF